MLFPIDAKFGTEEVDRFCQSRAEILAKTLQFRIHRVVYKSRQSAKFAGFSARFRRLLSLLHEPRYVEEMMFIRSKVLRLNKKMQYLSFPKNI